MDRIELRRFVNLMTQAQPSPPTFKNLPNPVGWVGSGWYW